MALTYASDQHTALMWISTLDVMCASDQHMPLMCASDQHIDLTCASDQHLCASNQHMRASDLTRGLHVRI